MLPQPLLKTLVSTSGVLSTSSFTLEERPGQRLLPVQCHWPSLWVYPARSEAHEKSLHSTSPKASPICTHSPRTDLLPSPYETLSDITWISPLVPLLSLLRNLSFNLLFPLSLLHISVRPDLTSIQFCTWTISWAGPLTNRHWTSHMWSKCFRAGSRVASQWQKVSYWVAKSSSQEGTFGQQVARATQQAENPKVSLHNWDK